MYLVNMPTTSLLKRVRGIQNDRTAKPKINLRRFVNNFPEQTRGRSLNHVTDMNTCLVPLSSSEFVNRGHDVAQNMRMTHSNGN
jgi:hypothetical protein